MKISCRIFRKIFLLGSLCWFNIGAYALTLEEALVAVYKDNPTLQSKREQAKQADEQIMDALSRWFPRADLQLQKQYSRQKSAIMESTVGPSNIVTKSSPTDTSSDGNISTLSITQNLFRSGGDIAQLNAARAAIKSAHANLEAAEQEVFRNTIEAYTDTLQYYEMYKTAEEREADSLKQLDGTKQKVAVGSETKTNLAQIEASYARAQSNRILQKANYEVKKAQLEALVGMEVKTLSAPKNLLSLPKNISDTIDSALLRNPSIISSKNSAEASKNMVASVRGEVLPKVNLQYQITDNSRYPERSAAGARKSYATVVELAIPILHVDSWSKLRSQKREAAQRVNDLQATRDDVRAKATAAWAGFESSKASLKASQNAYEAMKLAYAGQRASEKVGLVSMFDMISIREQYFKSYDQYIQSKAQYYQAMYALKAVVGECTARGLKLNVPLYDPRDNYNAIKWQIIGAF